MAGATQGAGRAIAVRSSMISKSGVEEVTGEVPSTTGYEAGFPLQQARIDDRWQPDPLVLDDQALIVDIKDKGLLVITGCGHAGIVRC